MIEFVWKVAYLASSFGIALGVNWVWWNRRRLLRRTPLHLRGRVPVDGRVSSVVRCTLTGEPDGACSAHRFCPVVRPDSQWTPPPDEKGRAFLRSVPPLPPLPKPEEDEPPRYVRRELGNGWVTHTLESLERAADMAQRQRETPQEAAQRMNNSGGPRLRLVQPSPLNVVPKPEATHRQYPTVFELEAVEVYGTRPKPAENARRYTDEGGTW